MKSTRINTRIPIGASTACFFGMWYTENCFDFYRQYGIDVAEVFLSSASEYTIEYAQHLNSCLDGVMVHSVHSLGIQYEAELLSTHDRVRGDAEAVLHSVCNAASILGAKYITFHGPLKLKRQQYLHNYDSLAIVINKLCDTLAGYGLKLSYENIHYGYFDDPEYFVTLSRLCPDLYATIDIKQAVQGGKNPVDFFKACKGRISTIHLCDVDINNKPCLPLEGVINFDSIFNYLVSNDIDAPLMLELYSNSYTRREQDIIDSYNMLAHKLSNTKGNIIELELKE